VFDLLTFCYRRHFQDGKDWMTQLLSVACLSLAAKMEETFVPQSLDLQVGKLPVGIALPMHIVLVLKVIELCKSGWRCPVCV
jgi:hypothetical protein